MARPFRVQGARAHENPASQARRVLNSARPPRVCYLIFSGRSPGLRGAWALKASPSHALEAQWI
ncbi:hypothetical protein AK972_2441 [Pseudomonas yamanorum]|nr:hypothetical protein AK972_2441 [Pseudomonas yamanorum]